MGFYQFFHYHVAPPLLILLVTPGVLFLVWLGDPDLTFSMDLLTGNLFSWSVVCVALTWAIIFLKIPSKTFKGPASPDGYVPIYQANGMQYYLITCATVLSLFTWKPEVTVMIMKNYGQIFASLSATAFILCGYLLKKGLGNLAKENEQKRMQQKQYPLIYQFYRGVELHPRIFNMDIKQLTNCRMGMMMWQVFIFFHLFAGWQTRGFNCGHFVNVLLQTIYICKFFWWETGYFNTLDITLDRPGFYLCWGCLVWVPSLYTFSSYFFYRFPPSLTCWSSAVVFSLGILSIGFNYWVDYQKQCFKSSKGKCLIWGKKPEYIIAEYTSPEGMKKSELLLSGFWRIARHLNYDFELMLAFSWNLPGLWEFGIWPYLYSIFLTVLLIHRVFRDEEKCEHKYGEYWKKYCNIVKYRMIPYVW